MKQEEYTVWLVCRNPGCRKLFQVSKPHAPATAFSSYEHAEEYASALKKNRLAELASGARDHRLANALGDLRYPDPDVKVRPWVACPCCSAVNRLDGIRHVVKVHACDSV